MSSNGKWSNLSCEVLTGTADIESPALKHIMQGAVVDMAKKNLNQSEAYESLLADQKRDTGPFMEIGRSIVSTCERKDPILAASKTHRLAP